jgi:hypothetical protein
MDKTPHQSDAASSKSSDPLEETSLFEHALTDESISKDAGETLFETYEPRPISAIIAHRNAIQESHAAEAAAVILDGVVPLEFDPEEDQAQQQMAVSDPERPYHHIRVQRTSKLGRFFSPGAQFIYALVVVTLLGGLIGLAATLQTPTLVLLSGILSPLMLPICVWKWIRWLDSDPYYYRLLTSLGEDAYNLLNYRLFWKRSG